MPVRQNESVPIDPLRVRRIMLHQLVVQQVSDRSIAERSPRVTGVRLLNRIDRKKTQCVDGELVEFVLLGILLFAHSFPLLNEESRAWQRSISNFWSISDSV